jgi:ParB-like chromosome segregation protein Spo0J
MASEFNAKYPLIQLDSIKIVDRPEESSKQIFFNPRSLASFTAEKMKALAYSIRTDGLQQPPIVRATQTNDNIENVELIAGERRIRSCLSLFANDEACYSDELDRPKLFKKDDIVLYKGRFGEVVKQQDGIVVVNFEEDEFGEEEQIECDYLSCFPTIGAKKLYEKIPCKVIYDCEDERALRLAFMENDQSEPLTIAEEISLVERLENSGYKQADISALLGANISWVSQTSNFQAKLPQKAYEKLLQGEITRHVAVSLMSYAEDKRESIFEAAIEAEKIETQNKINKNRIDLAKAQDELEIQAELESEAESAGDEAVLQRARRRSASASKKVANANAKSKRTVSESGHVRQGHLKAASAKTGIRSKKPKMLDRADIEDIFIASIADYIEGDAEDPETGEIVPADMAGIVRRTALAILESVRDPLSPIRDHMFDTGQWSMADEDDDEEDYEDEDEDEEDYEGEEEYDNSLEDSYDDEQEFAAEYAEDFEED